MGGAREVNMPPGFQTGLTLIKAAWDFMLRAPRILVSTEFRCGCWDLKRVLMIGLWGEILLYTERNMLATNICRIINSRAAAMAARQSRKAKPAKLSTSSKMAVAYLFTILQKSILRNQEYWTADWTTTHNKDGWQQIAQSYPMIGLLFLCPPGVLPPAKVCLRLRNVRQTPGIVGIMDNVTQESLLSKSWIICIKTRCQKDGS